MSASAIVMKSLQYYWRQLDIFGVGSSTVGW
ncbi:hypothetical protein MPC1_8090002 [Methylocella tundrae]|nr:hypothetical protein MPC1_8090002 [Methylocella tundrae]